MTASPVFTFWSGSQRLLSSRHRAGSVGLQQMLGDGRHWAGMEVNAAAVRPVSPTVRPGSQRNAVYRCAARMMLASTHEWLEIQCYFPISRVRGQLGAATRVFRFSGQRPRCAFRPAPLPSFPRRRESRGGGWRCPGTLGHSLRSQGQSKDPAATR